MSKALKSKITKYAVTIAVSLYMAYAYINGRDLGELSQLDRYHVLCDGFSLPGMLLILLGLLMKMNNVGALDTIAYGFSYVMHMIAPGAFDKMESYLDFVEARRENRKGGYGFLFVVGLIMMAIATVFLMLYYSVK